MTVPNAIGEGEAEGAAADADASSIYENGYAAGFAAAAAAAVRERPPSSKCVTAFPCAFHCLSVPVTVRCSQHGRVR